MKILKCYTRFVNTQWCIYSKLHKHKTAHWDTLWEIIDVHEYLYEYGDKLYYWDALIVCQPECYNSGISKTFKVKYKKKIQAKNKKKDTFILRENWDYYFLRVKEIYECSKAVLQQNI